jgi:hypothetical protein
VSRVVIRGSSVTITLSGDATSAEAVSGYLGERRPRSMVTDPPHGVELDSEWRGRAGLNGKGPAEPSYMKSRTRGHKETTMSGDTRADWSEAFERAAGIRGIQGVCRFGTNDGEIAHCQSRGAKFGGTHLGV